MSARVAIVTGSSSGIGQSTAYHLARAGFEVFGFSRRNESPNDVVAIRVDVRSDSEVRDAVQQVLSKAGKVDLLVNAAGYSVIGAIEESSMEQAQALFDTNVVGTMRVTRAVLPQMRAAGKGRIINIGSVVGLVPAPFMGIYSATKHAIEGYTESLDHEVRKAGVRCIVVEPGFTKTGIALATERADSPLAEYEAAANAANDLIKQALASGTSPDIVGKFVAGLAEIANPRHRYAVTFHDRLLSKLRRFMPEAVFDKSLRKQFQLD